jgi:hypothetical protein
MGFDLTSISDGSYFRFSQVRWYKLLELAQEYGWQPMGVEIAPGHLIDGGYRDNLGTVIAEDAISLAQALDRALDDISEEATGGAKSIHISETKLTEDEIQGVFDNIRKMGIGTDESGIAFVLIRDLDWDMYYHKKPEPAGAIINNFMLSPVDTFSGSKKQQLREFIDFCNKGAFRLG